MWDRQAICFACTLHLWPQVVHHFFFLFKIQISFWNPVVLINSKYWFIIRGLKISGWYLFFYEVMHRIFMFIPSLKYTRKSGSAPAVFSLYRNIWQLYLLWLLDAAGLAWETFRVTLQWWPFSHTWYLVASCTSTHLTLLVNLKRETVIANQSCFDHLILVLLKLSWTVAVMGYLHRFLAGWVVHDTKHTCNVIFHLDTEVSYTWCLQRRSSCLCLET